MTEIENVKHTQDQEGNPIVVMSEKQYKEMQKEIKRLRKAKRMEEMAGSFMEVRDIMDGRKEGKDLFELLDEL